MAHEDARQPEVRYYAIFPWGRRRISTASDEAALEWVRWYTEQTPVLGAAWKLLRIVKETKETIYEDRSAVPHGKPLGRGTLEPL